MSASEPGEIGGASHTFSNPSNAPAVLFNSFPPAFYVNYLRDMAALAATGDRSREGVERVMARYATELA
ncbi:MAG: hypothetical protein JO157_10410 [Acetobacteraceae bacterium]|nr:hypothetical protein [Acetobacteraceae bacterium]